MHFTTYLFPLAALASTISASVLPVQEAKTDLEKRVSPGFYFCTETGFGSPCYKDASPFGNCVTVGSDFNDKVSSAGPDSGTHCILYANNGCTGAQTTLYYPGSSDLRNQNFNDVMSSFRCYSG